MLLMFVMAEAFATDYYIDPVSGSDSDDGLTQVNAWSTFSHAMGVLSAGDTLYLMDGTYTGSNTGMLQVTISGTNGNPITFKALNDGQAIVDGQDSAAPCTINGAAANNPIHDINVEGIQFCNSNDIVVRVRFGDRINIKRVTAYDAIYTQNSMVMQCSESTNVLFEDCAAWGDGRKCFEAYESQNCIFRRCWGRITRHSGSGGGMACISLYGSDNCIIENCVFTQSSSLSTYVKGISVWANSYNRSANSNIVCGNIIRDVTGDAWWLGSVKYNIYDNHYYHNVSINTDSGFFQRGDSNLIVENLNIVTTKKYDCFTVQAITGGGEHI